MAREVPPESEAADSFTGIQYLAGGKRGEMVAVLLLDAELAALYGVETRTLIQAVQRNRARFPADFMFQLNAVEWLALRSQFVISKAGRGGRP
jgi:hypothetical protein